MHNTIRRLINLILPIDAYRDRINNILTQQYFSFFERQNAHLLSEDFLIKELINCKGVIANPSNAQNSTELSNIHCLMPEAVFSNKLSDVSHADEFTVWGHIYSKSTSTHAILANAIMRGKPVYIIEDGFFKSATTWADKNKPIKFRTGISFTIDDLACYYDALYPSRLELKLNSDDELTSEARSRARANIDFIIENNLTKYNHQPIYQPSFGRADTKKVLVVDQSYNDFSIIRSRANDVTFKRMLDDAITENPGASIIVKTHPDTIADRTERSGYYMDIKEEGSIITQRKAINPICLLKEMDKVYVCSSQMGFEALMCDCEVVVYGMPFYAGWGLTDDRHPEFSQKKMMERRGKKHSLEEVFHYAYIWYSHYVNPDRQSVCEIEEALEYILKIRNKYFKAYPLSD